MLKKGSIQLGSTVIHYHSIDSITIQFDLFFVLLWVSLIFLVIAFRNNQLFTVEKEFLIDFCKTLIITNSIGTLFECNWNLSGSVGQYRRQWKSIYWIDANEINQLLKKIVKIQSTFNYRIHLKFNWINWYRLAIKLLLDSI